MTIHSKTEKSLLKAPSRLKVGLLEKPCALNTKTPAFSWVVEDMGLDEVQTAYRIVLSKRLSEVQRKTYLKDTGWINSANNTAVKIDGIAEFVLDNELFYWQVQTQNTKGEQSPLSVPKPFRTKLGSEWKSTSGVWVNSAQYNLANFVFFRSPKLDIKHDEVEMAIVSMAASGTEASLAQMADLYVNGKSAGLGPARDYRNATKDGKSHTKAYYNAYDVSDYISDGNNVIAALAVCKDENIRALLIQLDIYYKNGAKETLTNSADGTWKALDATDAFGDKGETISAGGCFSMPKENIDVAKYPSDWHEVKFDDSAWETPIIRENLIENSTRILTPYSAENTLRFITDEPQKSVCKRDNGNWIIDLGKEIVGSLLMNITAEIDSTMTVRMGEQINDDGSVRYQLAAFPIYEECWKLKAGKNIFNTVLMKNFRYIELIGFTGTIKKDDIKGWAMRQEFDDEKSDFISSNELLNREYAMCKYSIKATNQDVFVDSQARERRAYEGDLLVNSNSSYVISDNYALARHSNEYLIDYPTWPLDYLLFSIEMAWQDYIYTGNDDSLREYYDKLQDKLKTGNWDESIGMIAKSDYDTYNSEESATQTNGPLIDWPVSERDGYIYGKYSTIFNAEFVGAYNIMAAIAAVVGDESNKEKYSDRAKRIKKNLLTKCYDPSKGAFCDSLKGDGRLTPNNHYSIHVSAYALAYGVFNSDDMKEKLTKYVGNNGNFKGSIYASYFILRGLYNADGGDHASALLTNTDTTTTKTFAYILDVLKATISPEAWDNSNKPNLTLSHPWGSSPACSIVQGMFGILPTTSGFASFNIKVQPGGVRSASVKTPTIRGTISVSYNGIGKEQVLAVTVPANTKASIYMPKFKDGMFREKTGNDGVTIFDENYQITEVGSGTREFYFAKP